MTKPTRPVQDVFDEWASDYHADGMEKGHWQAVKQAFDQISENRGDYLEVGVGNGYGIRHMATHQFKAGTCTGLDISPEMVTRARQKTEGLTNVSLESGDFLTWQPEGGRRFDLIFSMEVFYYFHDIQAGIDHAVSLLKPGGELWVLVNHYQENPESHTWPRELNTPMTLWSASDYMKGFENAGLTHLEQTCLVSVDEPGTLATRGRKEA